jgi:DNA-binding CsgD family transcriptional regulator
VSALVLNRLRRLSPAAIRVAEHVALLGSQAEVRHVCVLAALGEGEVLAASDELAAAGLLRPGQPLEFSHPVFRASVYESITAGRRAGCHGRAARLLGSENVAPARIAMHLLNTPAASARADVSCRRGALADAEQDATTALDLAQSHGRDYSVHVSAAALVAARTEQGRLAEAEAAAAEVRDSRGAKCDLAIYVCCLGWLRIAQGRPGEALADFQAAGSLAREAGHDLPGFWAWRAGAATAQLALGRRAEARSMAREQLQLVQPFGAPGPTGVALRTLGLIERGQAQLDLLCAATQELERSPALLERARAHLELGAALRRAGRRAESRQPLRAALDLADRCGAVVVARRAREELLAAGGRPRRSRIGGVEALTASELRVARRAASDRTNREIAQELFVTVKVVEKHLASAYRKLGIQGRGELAGVLGQTMGH